ncbi:MAG TPA: BBP7 family outer membrane beta-barrel protein [Lacipirellula sp.]
MTARRILHWFAAACALVAPSVAYGQAEDAFCDVGCYHEYQWFAPVDFDFDCTPIERECGWFFSFDKLSWATTGERTRVGTENPDTGSYAPFRNFLSGHAGDLGIPPNPASLLTRIATMPPEVLGGIDSGPPEAAFAWGERYELGYFNGDHGWRVGILDGPSASSNEFYGLATQDELYGSVLVVFDDPLDLMLGFIDVVDESGGAFQPDGQADDIDADGQYGYDGFDEDDPGRDPDLIFSPNPAGDFEDIVRLPTSFQTFTVRNDTKSDGVELMKTYRLSNLHKMVKHQNNEVEVAVGLRYLRLRDEFSFAGTGGTLGESFLDMRIDNNLVGPQVQANWTHQRHRTRFDLGGRFMFAYNIQNFDQLAGIGTDLVPGQLNRPLYFSPTVADHGKQEEFFSPTVELRAQAAYQVTQAFALKLGYTAVFVDNISRSASNVNYELPRLGFEEGREGRQEIFINGVNIGAELVY